MTTKRALTPIPKKWERLRHLFSEGIIMVKYLEKRITITSCCQADRIRRLAIKTRHGRLRAGVLFHQANTPTHKGTNLKVAIREMGVLEQPLYLPDLSLGDFYLISRLKKNLRGTKFEDDCEMTAAVEAFLEEQDKGLREFWIQKNWP